MSLEKLKDLKPDQQKLLCLEVNPPRGVDLSGTFERLDQGLEGIDFLNVTDSALAKMRLAPLPFATLLKERYGIEPVVNISCRDRNLIAIQGDLLAGWVTGIRSIVALTGDAVTIGDSPERKGVFEVNSIGLLHVIQSLNSGKDISGNDLKGAPAFQPGVVVNPNARNTAAEIKRLQRKKDAGALYALSQPIFDEEVATGFFKAAASVSIPIFCGLLPFKTAASAQGIAKIPGIRLSEQLMTRISESPDKDLSDFSIEHSLKLAALANEFVCGFHVIAGGAPKLAMRLCRELRTWISSTAA